MKQIKKEWKTIYTSNNERLLVQVVNVYEDGVFVDTYVEYRGEEFPSIEDAERIL